MKPSTLVLATVLIAFSAWSVWLVGFDYLGFVDLARREPWGAQITVDLILACGIASSFILRDARDRGLPALPYLLATVLLGSIGLLGYLVHRSLRARPAPTSRALGAAATA